MVTLPDYPPVWWQEPVRMYARMIEARIPFAQANYGDGEWECLLGEQGSNVNGEVYTPELAEQLRETLLKHSGMWLGTNPSDRVRGRADDWVRGHDLQELPWIFKESLSEANVHGGLAPFLKACRSRNVILVGPEHLIDLPNELIGARFRSVLVHPHDAWRDVDRIVDQVLGHLEPCDLVLFAAGMASNLCIHMLMEDLVLENDQATLLDVGALFDPYVGVLSIKCYRKPEWPEMMERNLYR